MKKKLIDSIDHHDAVITRCGAWNGDKELMAGCLEDLGWEKKYPHIFLGLRKTVGFGLLKQKPLFILPGLPSSNFVVAFLILALPRL